MTKTENQTEAKMTLPLKDLKARRRELTRDLERAENDIASHPDTIKGFTRGVPKFPGLAKLKSIKETADGVNYLFGRSWHTAGRDAQTGSYYAGRADGENLDVQGRSSPSTDIAATIKEGVGEAAAVGLAILAARLQAKKDEAN